MSKYQVKSYKSIDEIPPDTWNMVAANRGFQSHSWYSFGERVMHDSPPTYLIAWDGEKPIAGAALFKIKNEPLPLPEVARDFMSSILEKRPLLMCRSPLADTSALLLPGEPLRDEVLPVLAKAAQEEFKKQRCSFLVFDYLLTEQLKYPSWPSGYEAITVSEPGTYMPMEWENFEGYLSSRKDKDREQYSSTFKGLADKGIELSRHKSVTDVDAALRLIKNVSIWNGSAPSPWTQSLLENFSLLSDSTWIELRQNENLVGCCAVLRDNKFQLTTAVGLEDDVPGGYFILLYAALQDAFENKARLIRFGTGAYDIKHNLGFRLENTNHAMITMAGIMSRAAKQLTPEDK